MSCPRYCFVFTYEYLSGGWSFYCIYADDLQTAQKQFESIPDELYFIKTIDRKDNRYCAYEKGYEPETRVFTA
jgi:hypothetical protein